MTLYRRPKNGPASLLRKLEAPGDPDYADVADLRFSSDGLRIAWASDYGTVSIADVGSGRIVNRRRVEAVDGIAISPKLDLIAASIESTIKIYSSTTGSTLLSLSGHLGGAMALSFTQSGDRLVSAGMDGMLILWDIRKRKTRSNR